MAKALNDMVHSQLGGYLSNSMMILSRDSTERQMLTVSVKGLSNLKPNFLHVDETTKPSSSKDVSFISRGNGSPERRKARRRKREERLAEIQSRADLALPPDKTISAGKMGGAGRDTILSTL